MNVYYAYNYIILGDYKPTNRMFGGSALYAKPRFQRMYSMYLRGG
jgi:hypothetical protein